MSCRKTHAGAVGPFNPVPKTVRTCEAGHRPPGPPESIAVVALDAMAGPPFSACSRAPARSRTGKDSHVLAESSRGKARLSALPIAARSALKTRSGCTGSALPSHPSPEHHTALWLRQGTAWAEAAGRGAAGYVSRSPQRLLRRRGFPVGDPSLHMHSAGRQPR